jgi:uncharacterized membrane protein
LRLFRSSSSWVFVLLLLAACSRPEPREAAEGEPGELLLVYTCEQGGPITARVGLDSVDLDLATHTLSLPQVVSGSGARYAADGVEFWMKGGEARFDTPDGSDRCQGTRADSPWEAARLRGAIFRAIGQEPGWSVEAVPGLWIHYRGQYGEQNIVMPLPEPRELDGETLYQSGTDARSLIVRLQEQPCQDVMSGEEFELTVTVDVDGDVLRGCGRRL